MSESEQGRGRGRPRTAETDLRIKRAALELLRSQGPRAVNIDAVAARSGVARTTIYRRYGNRAELMGAVLDELVDAPLPAPSVPVTEKLLWMLERILLILEEGIGRGGTAALLTDSDPEFTSALRERMAGQLQTLEQAMSTDVAEGRLRRDVDPDTLVGLLFGAYLSEALRYGEPRNGWAERTVAVLSPAVTPSRPVRGRGR